MKSHCQERFWCKFVDISEERIAAIFKAYYYVNKQAAGYVRRKQ
jgi:hypothetical protein